MMGQGRFSETLQFYSVSTEKIALEYFNSPRLKVQNKLKFLQNFTRKLRAERIEGYGLLGCY
jgi:hypothetical protein